MARKQKFAPGKKRDMAIQARSFWFTGIDYFRDEARKSFDGGEVVGFSVAPSNREPDHYYAQIQVKPKAPGRPSKRPWLLLSGWMAECVKRERKTFSPNLVMIHKGEGNGVSRADPNTGVVTIWWPFRLIEDYEAYKRNLRASK